MQDAYVVDQQDKGTFEQIGYEKPTSTVFTYTDNNKSFQAVATVLDKCGSAANAQTWTIGVSVSGGKATYTPSDNCSALTPNFKYIGSSKAD